MENAYRSIPRTESANQAIRPPPQPGQLNLQPPAFIDEVLSKTLGQWWLFLVCFKHVHSFHAHLIIIKFHSNMSVADAVDQLHNTTSIPSTGIYPPPADQFFCRLTKFDVRCVSLAPFAAQPFYELCPSRDCWTRFSGPLKALATLADGIRFAN